MACECGCGGQPRSGRRFIQHHHLRRHGRYVGHDHRGRHLIRTYGVTPEQYERMLAAQGGKCAICLSPPTGKRPLSVDHNHETGAVRGLLCVRCNSCLGWVESFGDSVEAYLETY